METLGKSLTCSVSISFIGKVELIPFFVGQAGTTQGTESLTMNQTDTLPALSCTLWQLGEYPSPSSYEAPGLVTCKLSASDQVESERVPLNPWGSYLLTEPQFPHPRMGYMDPRGICQCKWVRKPLLPPPSASWLSYWQQVLARAVGR